MPWRPPPVLSHHVFNQCQCLSPKGLSTVGTEPLGSWCMLGLLSWWHVSEDCVMHPSQSSLYLYWMRGPDRKQTNYLKLRHKRVTPHFKCVFVCGLVITLKHKISVSEHVDFSGGSRGPPLTPPQEEVAP
jgi:hypothetical protein